jgi:hypothetical protein
MSPTGLRAHRTLGAIGVAALTLVACGGSELPTPHAAPDPGAEQADNSAAGATNGGTTGSTGPSASGAAANVLRFTPQAVTDPASNNVTAITYLVPQGWQSTAGVQWLPEWSRLAFLQTRVNDPTSGVIIEWLPIQDFIWFQAPAGFNAPIGGNYQGKAYVPPIADPVQFVSQFWFPGALAHLQSARLVNVTQVPAIAEDFKRNFGGPADAFAYRMRYEVLVNGTTWEEDVSFALLYAGNSSITSWYVNYAYTVRAPKGVLDRLAGVISTVLASRNSTPEWEANFRLVQRLFTQGIQQQMADTEAFGRTLAAHRAESAALQAQVTAERAASQDRIAELRRETLGGVETYNDPVNRVPVQLPVGFNEYWVNTKGEYLTSSQAGFDPNTLNSGFWQRLERRG